MIHKSINRENESKLKHSNLVKWLDYDPETGIFIWKIDCNSRAMRGYEAGSPHPKLGHFTVQIDKVRYLLHRLAWFYIHKEWPLGIIDHIDRNPSNNAISNLRDTNQSVNMHNAKLRSDNTSGVKGVSYMSSRNCWRARIDLDGKEIHIGSYFTKEEAIQARQQAEQRFLK